MKSSAVCMLLCSAAFTLACERSGGQLNGSLSLDAVSDMTVFADAAGDYIDDSPNCEVHFRPDCAIDARVSDGSVTADAYSSMDGSMADTDEVRDVSYLLDLNDVLSETGDSTGITEIFDPPEVDISPIPAVHATEAVSAGRVFSGDRCTFVTASDGSLWGWGDNHGYLQPSDGRGPVPDIRTQPQRVDGVRNVREMFLSFNEGLAPCALDGSGSSGSLYCWGYLYYWNHARFFGGSWGQWRFPHRMGTVSDVVHIYYGTDVVRSDMSLWRAEPQDDSWSSYPDYSRRLLQAVVPGIKRTRDSIQAEAYLAYYMDTAPQLIAGIIDLAGGRDFACVLLDTGRVMCWGMNSVAQTGTGYEGTEVCHREVRDSPTTWHTEHAMCVRRPTLVPGLTDVVKVSLGEGVGCALRRDGSVWCWGWNVAMSDGRGTLGDGRPAAEEQCIPYDVVDGGVVPEPSRAVTCRRAPTRVVGIDDAIDISVGVDHQCAVRATGQVLCWGFNGRGQLGTGDTMARALPTPVRWY